MMLLTPEVFDMLAEAVDAAFAIGATAALHGFKLRSDLPLMDG
jgi:hypothetical protein